MSSLALGRNAVDATVEMQRFGRVTQPLVDDITMGIPT